MARRWTPRNSSVPEKCTVNDPPEGSTGAGGRRGGTGGGGTSTTGFGGEGAAIGSGGDGAGLGAAAGKAWVTSGNGGGGGSGGGSGRGAASWGVSSVPPASPAGISSRTSSSTERNRMPIPDWLRRASSGGLFRAWATTPSTMNPRSRSTTSMRTREPDDTGLLVATNIPVSEMLVV